MTTPVVVEHANSNKNSDKNTGIATACENAFTMDSNFLVSKNCHSTRIRDGWYINTRVTQHYPPPLNMNTRSKKTRHRRHDAPLAGAAGGGHVGADPCDNPLLSLPVDPLMKILMPAMESLHADGMFGCVMPTDSLADIVQKKCINKMLRKTIRTYMHGNKQYCDAVRKLSLFVPGTRIPCGIENATPLLRLHTRAECVQLFDKTSRLLPNNVRVGGIYLPALHLENWNEYGTWDGPEDVDGAVTHPTFYMTISLHFLARPFFHILPAPIGNRVDVSGIPNTLRRVLGLHETTCDFQTLREERDRVGQYFRLLQVRSDHTIQDIFDSISLAEGWNPVEDYGLHQVTLGSPYSFFPLTRSVSGIIQTAESAGIACRPSITWQHFAVPLNAAYQDTSDDDSDGSGEARSLCSEQDNDDGNSEDSVAESRQGSDDGNSEYSVQESEHDSDKVSGDDNNDGNGDDSEQDSEDTGGETSLDHANSFR